MFISLAGILVGIWMIVESNQLPQTTLTLLLGIIIAALSLFELLSPHLRRVP